MIGLLMCLNVVIFGLAIVSFAFGIWGIVVGSGIAGSQIGVWLIVQGGVDIGGFILGCICKSPTIEEQENGERLPKPCTSCVHQLVQLFTLGWLSYGIYLFVQHPENLNSAFQVILWFGIARIAFTMLFVCCIGCFGVCGILNQSHSSTTKNVVLNIGGTHAITLV